MAIFITVEIQFGYFLVEWFVHQILNRVLKEYRYNLTCKL